MSWLDVIIGNLLGGAVWAVTERDGITVSYFSDAEFASLDASRLAGTRARIVFPQRGQA